MSQDQLRSFLEILLLNKGLRERLAQAADAEAIAEIAVEAGFQVLADDFKYRNHAVTESELEGIAGSNALSENIYSICTAAPCPPTQDDACNAHARS